MFVLLWGAARESVADRATHKAGEETFGGSDASDVKIQIQFQICGRIHISELTAVYVYNCLAN